MRHVFDTIEAIYDSDIYSEVKVSRPTARVGVVNVSWKGSTNVDIKIGFIDSPRELTVSVDQDHDAAVELVTSALENPDGIFTLTDTKGAKVLVRNSQIAYVQIGRPSPQAVGFAGV